MLLSFLAGKPLAVGAAAPAFSLPDQNGNTISLQSLRGKPVVLVFYPGDDTLICTRQLCEIRDDWSEFQKLGATVLGVNRQDASSHSSFISKYNFPFPLLVDSGNVMCRAYKTGRRFVFRTVYVIGPDGRIVYAQRGKPSTAEILSAIEGSRSASAATS